MHVFLTFRAEQQKCCPFHTVYQRFGTQGGEDSLLPLNPQWLRLETSRHHHCVLGFGVSVAETDTSTLSKKRQSPLANGHVLCALKRAHFVNTSRDACSEHISNAYCSIIHEANSQCSN